MDDFQGFSTGWIDDPGEVALVAGELAEPVFGDTQAGTLPESEIPDHVYLWDLARKVTGDLLPPRNQRKVGSCVGFGTARANEYSMLAEIAQGQQEEFRPLAPEVIYGGSRVEIGGGRLRSDGSVGAWAAKWCSQYGLVSRGLYGKLDLREYKEDVCRQLGASGIPPEVESVAKQHPVRGITLVKTTTELRKALAQGFAVSICSSVGFEYQRDSRGVCRQFGRWNHCMCACGFATIDGKVYYRIDNSWGDMAHTGPVGPGNPGPEGFYCEESAMAQILSAGDSWAFSDINGFVRKPVIVDWFI